MSAYICMFGTMFWITFAVLFVCHVVHCVTIFDTSISDLCNTDAENWPKNYKEGVCSFRICTDGSMIICVNDVAQSEHVLKSEKPCANMWLSDDGELYAEGADFSKCRLSSNSHKRNGPYRMTLEADATCYIRDKDETAVWSFPPKRTVYVLTSDAGCILRSGDELLSDNGKYALVIEQNGSMYMRGPSMNDKKVLWNVPVKYLTICNEGKIRLFDYNDKSTIYNGKSKLEGEAPFSLCCDDNGILRIYDGKEVVRGLPENCKRVDVFQITRMKNYLKKPYSSFELPLDSNRYIFSGQQLISEVKEFYMQTDLMYQEMKRCVKHDTNWDENKIQLQLFEKIMDTQGMPTFKDWQIHMGIKCMDYLFDFFHAIKVKCGICSKYCKAEDNCVSTHTIEFPKLSVGSTSFWESSVQYSFDCNTGILSSLYSCTKMNWKGYKDAIVPYSGKTLNESLDIHNRFCNRFQTKLKENTEMYKKYKDMIDVMEPCFLENFLEKWELHVIKEEPYLVYQRMRYVIGCHLDASCNMSNKIFSITNNSAKKYRIDVYSDPKLPYTLRRKCLLNLLGLVTFDASNRFKGDECVHPFDVKDVIDDCSIKLSRVSN